MCTFYRITQYIRYKADIPTLDHPFADFPKIQYPLAQYEAENRIAETESLLEVRNIIRQRREAGKPVAALITEPLQSEGGDNRSSDEFYRRLRQLCLDEEVLKMKIRFMTFNLSPDLII